MCAWLVGTGTARAAARYIAGNELLVKCKSLWGERECLLSVIIYKTVVYAACNTERLYTAHM